MGSMGQGSPERPEKQPKRILLYISKGRARKGLCLVFALLPR